MNARAPIPSSLLFLAAVLAAPLRAQTPSTDPAPGRVAERLAARADTTQKYALYLPSAYAAEKRWPVMFVMDPRGRALLPLELFREAAERHGWVLMSSYNTLSDVDTAYATNERALNAMLDDAQRRWSLDRRRVYLAGFSGTARNAWIFVDPLGEHLAGVVAVGGGYPGARGLWLAALSRMRPFAHFGIAGDADFNHDEMRRIDADLDGTALPHRFAAFPGAHQWPPRALAAEALEWMQLLAMKDGLAPKEEAWIDSLLAARRDRARRLEASDALLHALDEHRALAADFAGVRDVAAEEARAAELRRDARVTRRLARRAELGQRVIDYKTTVLEASNEFRSARGILPPARVAARLRLAALRREAADTADREGSAAARRMLESALAPFAYYLPRDYLAAKDFARALGALRVAEEIRPGTPAICYSMARAHAGLGDRAAALDALACAVDAGVVPPATLDRDPLLDPLRADPRFGELRERARARSETQG